MMADFRLTTVLSTLVLLCGSLVCVCQSCSPPEGWRPPTLADMILRAHNVLYGEVRGTYPDERHSTAYTVELEVYCILKGATTPLVVNITGGGYIPGHCEASEYLVGHVYILRAYNQGESDEQIQLAMAGTHINATQENLEGITKACGLNPVTRPTGASSSETECPVSVTDCQSEPTPNIDTPIPPEEITRDEEFSVYSAYDTGAVSKMEIKTGESSSSAAFVTVITTTTLTALAAALFFNKIIQ